MKSSTTNSELTRRTLLFAGACGAVALRAAPARALSSDEARSLIDAVVNDIHRVINSGMPIESTLKEFEKIFLNYADVQAIARSALGPPARTASPGQVRAFTAAFSGYIARKYGKRFREFKGGAIEVTDARKRSRVHEVRAIARLRGREPLAMSFVVSDRSGKTLFIDILIEGISLLKSERVEIGALLDKQGGDVDRLVAALNGTG
ncbi:MAG: ABC transporter substrate-binding protein [Boseongicola sp. SB0664_bin_43]|uniref:ABC transporter substrate-binding protein n=1 Tax=Boseongicola sp. SB0664_bin_43 TaxID=2604844 RepID=A0A6B0XZ33_9RHOB|nr:ABC transporter substrate-binding protein [Boseongicola sp. SB0664_bin_43]MYK31367.1 ABC transporter substrate-binding protein [Boseongicola sp. SB0670_bin_30]